MLTVNDPIFARRTFSPMTCLVTCLRVLLVVLAISAVRCSNVFTLYSDWVNSNAPQQGLINFAAQEINLGDTSRLEDVKLDGMDVVSVATCVGGKSVKNTQDNLRKQMRNLPEAVIEDIVDSAVLEGTDSASSNQQTVTDISNKGMAHSYMSYWKTTYSGEKAIIGSNYNTCVVVASVELYVAEVVASYEVETNDVKVGSEPCHCGFFVCERCDVFKSRETKKPIFKRYALNFEDHDNLHMLMSKKAVDSIAQVVDQPLKIKELASSMREQEQVATDVNWRAPNEHFYIG